MKKIIALLLGAGFACSLAVAGIPSAPLDSGNPFVPAGVDTAGGPDTFGYTWKDNFEPGGPTYSWIDISTIGTEVTGLGDDNYMGPYQVGFPFRYYWYDVNQFYIGSNGYLKFGNGYNISQAFPATIPLPADPNDFLAVYIADWWFGSPMGTGECYYWTDGADSCIVSWIDVPAWTAGSVPLGSHTFQVILARTDSSITFQYGNQQDTVSNNDQLVGIECNTGQVGLLHSFDTYRIRNSAIKFYYPETVTYQVHDLAAYAVSNPNSEGFFLEVGSTFTPWAVVKNVGNQTETSYTAQFLIQASTGQVQYNQSVSGGPIAPGAEQIVTYAATWTPSATAQYFTRLTVTLIGDMNTSNNLKSAECHALTLPGTLLYDDGVPDTYLNWLGGGGGNTGAANRFVPPVYPVRIDSIRIHCYSSGTNFIAQIRDDDGPSGIPGTILSVDTVTVSAAGWYGVDVSEYDIQITDGAFYVTWLMLVAGNQLGEDTNPMGSRQGWEYTGVWSPYRNAETNELMIRARISALAGPNQPPEIVSYYPTDLDTVALNDAVDFGVTATDPNGDPLSYVWKLDDVVQGTDSTVTIIFNEMGAHEVGVWVSDGELSDSLFWDVTVVAVGVEPFERTIPTEYALETPHPNPFNPTTTITFSLPLAGDVRLSVYDQTGREIAKLVAGWRPAGTHQVVFDATGFSSGIYLVKMMTGNFTASQKIVMMK